MQENDLAAPNISVLPEQDQAPRDLSDDTLALQFTEEFSGKARYTPEIHTWHVWDGSRWKRDNINLAANHCRRMLRSVALKCYKSMYNRLYDPTTIADEGPKARTARRNQAKAKAISSVKALKSQRTRDSVLKMAIDDPRITAAPDKWDGERARMLTNTPTGTVDLKTGILRPPAQSDFITKMTRVSPSNMPTPNWDRFLLESTKNDIPFIQYLQRVFGYCLTGDTSEQTLFFCHGPTGTGKSVITNAISYALGEYRYDTSEGTFSANSSDRHTQDIARLVNARFVTAQETDAGSKWNESRIKRLTGQDKITARLMRQNDVEYTPQMKIFIIGNHKPSLSSIDDAIRRRFHLIPFTERVPPERMNKRLGDALELEAPGILSWMIRGCLSWQEIGLSPPSIVTKYTNKYLYEEDNIAAWIEECCNIGANTWTRTGDLYADWKRWALSSGVDIGAKNTFSEYLDSRSDGLGIRKARKAQGPGFSNISLVSRSTQYA